MVAQDEEGFDVSSLWKKEHAADVGRGGGFCVEMDTVLGDDGSFSISSAWLSQEGMSSDVLSSRECYR